jgi:hypothetical protein
MPAKQSVSKKAPTKKNSSSKKSSPVKKVTKNTSVADMKSFRVYKPTEDFRKVRFSRQTVYWLILLTVITVSQLWIVHIQLQIAELTNELVLSSESL